MIKTCILSTSLDWHCCDAQPLGGFLYNYISAHLMALDGFLNTVISSQMGTAELKQNVIFPVIDHTSGSNTQPMSVSSSVIILSPAAKYDLLQ